MALDTNKERAGERLEDLKREARDLREGRAPPKIAEHLNQPLEVHLEDYRRSLASGTNTAGYVALTARRVQTVLLDGCGCRQVNDIEECRVADFLARLRAGEVGVEGKSIGLKTSNHYATAVKGFTRWLLLNGRAWRDPLAKLKKLNAKVDVRHQRRDLSPAELTALLEAARTSTDNFRGLTGTDRHFLYLTACGTSFRAGELASLTPASFDLAAKPVRVRRRTARTVRKPSNPSGSLPRTSPGSGTT
jgi:integrase